MRPVLKSISLLSNTRKTGAGRSFLIALLTILGGANITSGASGDLKVIAHPGVKASEISRSELKSVFLGTRTTLKDGGQVSPVLEKGGLLLAEFSRDYLGKTDVALETYYRSLVFTGRWSMPPVFSTDAEVVAYVAKTPGAIGFVHDTAAAAGVKTLRVNDGR